MGGGGGLGGCESPQRTSLESLAELEALLEAQHCPLTLTLTLNPHPNLNHNPNPNPNPFPSPNPNPNPDQEQHRQLIDKGFIPKDQAWSVR